MAKKITEETLQLNINGDAARKVLLDQEQVVKDNTAELARMQKQLKALENSGDTGSKKYKKLTAAIEEQKKALASNKEQLEALRSQQSISSMTLEELRKHSTQVRTALSKAVPGTENFKRLTRELQQTRSRMKELEATTAATDQTLCGMAERFRDYAIGASAIFAAGQKLLSYVTKATDAFKL